MFSSKFSSDSFLVDVLSHFPQETKPTANNFRRHIVKRVYFLTGTPAYWEELEISHTDHTRWMGRKGNVCGAQLTR